MVFSAAAGAVLVALLVLTGSGAATNPVGSDVTANWAGYVVVGPGSTETTASGATTYTDVTGRWILPKAVCRPKTPTSAAIWVGLGGYSVSSKQLEQAGTEVDCDAKQHATYYVWYELVPSGPVQIKGLRIHPGDTIVSTILADETGLLLQVTDSTRRTRFTRHVDVASPDLHSAEWIVEAPVECSPYCRQTALTKFAPLAFTHAYATANGTGATIGGGDWLVKSLRMVPRSYRVFGGPVEQAYRASGAGAAATQLSPDGTGFTVNWLASPAGTTS
jgi:hypothetical protein